MTAPEVDQDTAELREALWSCLAVPRWVDETVARGPFTSMIALLDAAAAAANPLTEAEIDQALGHHPRIGERPQGEGTAASLSRAEQASSESDDADLAADLAEGNRTYEEKFGRVFLIRAAGRSRADILGELRRRLALDPARELATVASELRDIALLRLTQLVDAEGRPVPREPGATSAAPAAAAAPAEVLSRVTTHVLDAVRGRPAAGVAVRLERWADSSWRLVAEARTDDDGRVGSFGPADLPASVYRVRFDTGGWFAATGQTGFYPEVVIVFTLDDPGSHYHVPLLLSPYAYSTYRGS